MSFVFKLNILIFICSCGTVIPTDKLVNSSVNSAEISTIISNVSDSFSASASDSSIANGAEVLIAPGSLAIGTSVSISAAEDIASNDLDGMLGTSGITPGGPAVYFESSGSTISSNPMTITLPISSTSLATQNIVVIYKTFESYSEKKSENDNYYIGVIPTKNLVIKDNKVQLKTKRFGAYQVAFSQEEISSEVEVETPQPIVKIDMKKDDLIYGTWQTDCTTSNSDSELRSYQSRISISDDDTYVEKFYEYDNNNCSEKTLLASTFMTRGQIKLGIENYRGIREINIKPKSVYYSFKNQPEVNKMNQQKFCGFSNWERNEYKNVTNSDCIDSHSMMTIFTIMKATQNNIYTGDTSDYPGDSPETRPTEINLEYTLERATN